MFTRWSFQYFPILFHHESKYHTGGRLQLRLCVCVRRHQVYAQESISRSRSSMGFHQNIISGQASETEAKFIVMPVTILSLYTVISLDLKIIVYLKLFSFKLILHITPVYSPDIQRVKCCNFKC